MIEVPSIEWWQALAALLAVLGLSPAPWILGLALGRIQFTATARADAKTLSDALVASHAAAIAELNAHHAAQNKIRDAADADREEAWETRYGELKESRDYYREARIVEVEQTRKVTDQLADVATEAGKIANAALSTIDKSTRGSA